MSDKDLIQEACTEFPAEPRQDSMLLWEGASSASTHPAYEHDDAEESEAEYKNHAATVAREPTDAQVEAAAKAYDEHHGIWGDEFREQVCPECGYLYFTEEQRRMGTDSREMYRKVERHRMCEALIAAGVARAVVEFLDERDGDDA